jgi:hypothetical protein
MGFQIDRRAAEGRFMEALALAKSDKKLPKEWIIRTERVAKAKSRTFIPVLGTALLAKATDRRIDAFSLREGEGHKSYSARSLAKDVLVPCCVREGIDIRNTGAEPLNNQPFFHATKIGPDLNVKPNAKADLEYLCECITAVDFLEGKAALLALAAFLRARVEATESRVKAKLGKGTLPLPKLLDVLEGFVRGDPEGGRVGQAFVAAIFDLLFSTIRTKRVNDPSMKWPGDVGAFEKTIAATDEAEEVLIFPAEVKQRSFSETEILLFAQRVSQANVSRCMVVALNQGDTPLDLPALRQRCQEKFGIELALYLNASSLLTHAIWFSPQSLDANLMRFPERMLDRLQELEVSEKRCQEWAAHFE